ncbi:MAG: fatty acid oxidation complex subunit alpha FadB [Reyranella sp.]|nr:fatty acid oxidation complex subunit alpha FadB [Reyranella sp.]MBP7609312.1 fatty acid oxidation complex subunit alpha FadB [Steroidobacteraceae bacterium]
MLYTGPAFSAAALGDGIVELKFDLAGESVNKLNQVALRDFAAATQVIAKDGSVKGVVVTSGKAVFIVGADITEFGAMFAAGEAAIAKSVLEVNRIFSTFEDLPVPTVVAINGVCLGGGLELALCADYRVMSTAASVGFPEVKLGIFPGFGGSVRMPRIVGVDNAVEWICSGADKKADAALKDGAVDAVVAPEQLRDAAVSMLQQCIAGKLDWQGRRAAKLAPLKLNKMELTMAFTSSMAVVGAQAGHNYPAPMLALKNMQEAATLGRDAALEVEAKYFAKAALTPQAGALIGVFLADQGVKRAAGAWEKKSKREIKQAAVLGAGIMGGGIAYQAAYKGLPIVMKDIRDDALALGMNEAGKLLAKQVEKGRMTPAKMSETLGRIRPTLNYGDFGNVDIIIEAVVENPKVKKAVFAEVEGLVREDTIIASNTSTISISLLAEGLKRPQNFVGMHFFNPVNMMPLVEVIRGKQSSEEAVAATVKLASKMGKTPVVVNDCPGFFVNRVLFPYFAGFHMLLRDGADFQAIDKAMERFGWPMGPAYLMDVVGMDTGVHAAEVMAQGFPDRMRHEWRNATQVLVDNQRYGQKNGKGYYVYAPDKKGKPKKAVDPATYDLIKGVVAERKEFAPEEIVARCMVPMVNEVARCLEEKIVASPQEADMSLLYGVGFPPFRGGACRYVDQTGAANYVAAADKLASLGKVYEVPQLLRDMAASGKKFFG